ncbi:acyltransferase [Aureimonas sp. AU12]|uniref:acyltransferase family protein n=1 Tax=Aureimonas sp. AU12 TaxID=1638161 RepID=UPI000781D061|nr:acyltransferase [Aureimonas sp. AU12]
MMAARSAGPPRPARNRNLQWLRAFAAICVLLYHASVYLDRFVGDDRFVRVFDGRFGLLGVAIFFALSGYLMAEILPRTDPWRFLAHRIVRIYPIFFIVLGSLIVARGKLHEYDFWAMTLVPVGEGRIYYLGVEWTLLFETTFYVFLFLCSLIGLKRRVEAIALIWLAIIAFGTWWLPAQQIVLTPTIDLLPMMAVNSAFAGGLLIPWLARRGLFQPAVGALAMGVMMLSGAFSIGGDRWVASVAAVLLVGLAVSWDRGDRRPDERLASLADRYGDWSYALYLCHAPLIIALMILHPPIPSPLLWVVGVVGPLAIAIPYGLLDLKLYAILRRTIDAWPGAARVVLASSYAIAFMALAAVAATVGTGRNPRVPEAQPVLVPEVPPTETTVPTLMPAAPTR